MRRSLRKLPQKSARRHHQFVEIGDHMSFWPIALRMSQFCCPRTDAREMAMVMGEWDREKTLTLPRFSTVLGMAESLTSASL